MNINILIDIILLLYNFYYFITLFTVTESDFCELPINKLGLVALLGLVVETVNGTLVVVKEMEALLDTGILDIN